MKIKMLNTRYDEEKNVKVYEANELFYVEETLNSFYILKTIDGIQYAVEKEKYGTEFVEIM